MTQWNKDILLRDLCGRLPYGVMLKHVSTEKPFKLFSIKRDEYASYKKDGIELAVNGIYYDWYVNDTYHDIELYIKPYLFPLSSMTEEIKNEIYEASGVYDIDVNSLVHIEVGTTFKDLTKIFHILNKHHIDYNGLIPMGMALDATGLNIY